jgi:hypothetical protein
MKRRTAVLLLLLPIALHPARSQGPTAYVYRGTVETVQPQAGSLDLITGVGMALRLVHIRTSPATRMASGTTTLTLKTLKPGDVIRADCHTTEQGPVADRIERILP